MRQKWKSPRCEMSGKPYVERDGQRFEALPGQQKCPKCRRSFFVNERRKWPTHGYYKMSFKYGE